MKKYEPLMKILSFCVLLPIFYNSALNHHITWVANIPKFVLVIVMVLSISIYLYAIYYYIIQKRKTNLIISVFEFIMMIALYILILCKRVIHYEKTK